MDWGLCGSVLHDITYVWVAPAKKTPGFAKLSKVSFVRIRDWKEGRLANVKLMGCTFVARTTSVHANKVYVHTVIGCGHRNASPSPQSNEAPFYNPL